MKKLLTILLIIIVILLTLLILFLIRNSNKNQINELKFRITWDKVSSRGVAIDKIVDSYNQSQNKVHITMIGGDEDRDEYISALYEDEIDVYMVPYRYIRDSQISQEFIQLTDLFMEQEEYYYDAIKPLAKSNDGIVAIPWIGHSMALIYNKSIVEEAGVYPEEFKSMQDLLDACEIIDRVTEHKGLGLVGADSHDLTWMVSQFIYSFDGELVEVDIRGEQTDVLIDSPESIKALDFYINELGEYAQDGWEEHTGSGVVEAFRNSEIAFEIQGPWGITDVWKCGCDFEVGAISLTQMNMYSEVGPLMLAISKDTEYTEGAKEFIRYLTDKKTLERVMDGEYDDKYEAYYPYRVPLRKDMEESAFFKKYPEFLVFIEGYQKPSINTPTTTWGEEYKETYAYYIHQAIVGNITIEEALQSISNK